MYLQCIRIGQAGHPLEIHPEVARQEGEWEEDNCGEGEPTHDLVHVV